MLRGLVKPPAILVAFHPLANTLWKLGLPAPGHDAGIATGALTESVGVGLTLVARVLVEEGAGALDATGPFRRLALISSSKPSMRAAFRSWYHLP